jgi:hypothetical protein
MTAGGRPGYWRVKFGAPPRSTNLWILPVAVQYLPDIRECAVYCLPGVRERDPRRAA